MAIVTFAGKEYSQVLAHDSFGRIPLRNFTVRFDVAGNPVATDRGNLVDTLFRLNGQAAL